MIENRTTYQPHIDGLRAIAVLAVLLFHLRVPGFGGGFVGVDVFLVISGFLITRLIEQEIRETGSLRFGHFYLRRARRIIPALLATVAASLVLGALVFSTGALRRLGSEAATSLLSVSNIYFWLNADYFDASARTQVLLHTWSLGIEEQFYLFAPAALYILLRSRLRRWAPFAVLALAAASLAINPSFGQGLGSAQGVMNGGFQNGKSTIFFLLPFRLFEFGIGAALPWGAARQIRPIWGNDLAFGAGLALIAFSTATYSEEMLFPSYYALVPCAGAALAIHAGDRSRLAPILKNRVAVGIGRISYSLYLVHWPVIVFWSYLSRSMEAWEQVLASCLSIALAIMSYRLVETPFRSGKIRLRWLLPVAIVTLVSGLHMWKSGGWPWRLGAHVALETKDLPSAAEAHRLLYGGADYRAWGHEQPVMRADILLIGDSYGLQYGEGLRWEVAEPLGYTFRVQAGTSCLHLPGFIRTTPGQDWKTLCPKSVDDIRLLLRGLADKPVVVMSHAWLDQMANAVLVDEQGRPVPRALTANDVIEGILRLKSAAGIDRLVVIGQIPRTSGVNLFDEMLRPPLARSRSIEELTAPTPIQKGIHEFNERLAEAAKRTGAFVFLDPADALCRQGLCDVVDELGHPLYSDGSHLSRTGSRRVVRAFLPRLLEVLGPPRHYHRPTTPVESR